MKHIQKLKAAAVAAFTMAGGAVSAQAITIETVTVGNIGNAADATHHFPGFGAVAYEYQIGKYEVTNTQYVGFLNAAAKTDTYGLYDPQMGTEVYGGITQSGSSGSFTYAAKSGFENKPVVYVSFWDTARFANWMNNGQGSGSTETGSYTLGGVQNPGLGLGIRNSGATWVVADEHEWYKAAYYSPNRNGPGAGGYWLHATQSNTLGSNTDYSATTGANYENFGYANGGLSGPGTTDVGAYSNATSYYGTFDQGGNVAEWNETFHGGPFNERIQRGGTWFNIGPNALLSSGRASFGQAQGANLIGFRLVSLAPIPEPSTYGAAMGVMALGVVMMRRRKARGTV